MLGSPWTFPLFCSSTSYSPLSPEETAPLTISAPASSCWALSCCCNLLPRVPNTCLLHSLQYHLVKTCKMNLKSRSFPVSVYLSNWPYCIFHGRVQDYLIFPSSLFYDFCVYSSLASVSEKEVFILLSEANFSTYVLDFILFCLP